MATKMTLTEASIQKDFYTVVSVDNKTTSNARLIPYIEIYAGLSGIVETPIERIQEAVRDEAKRKAS